MSVCSAALFGSLALPGCSDSEDDPSPKNDASVPYDGSIPDASGKDSAAETSTDSAISDAPETDGAIPAPNVTGPITGGRYGIAFNSMPDGLATKYGYSEQEFFVSGSARSYQATAELARDGRWSAKFSVQAPYKTRFIVRKPTDPQKFNGTVIVEWLNVSGGVDADPDFGFAHEELLRSGYAYVGVTAQRVGIVGGQVIVEVPGIKPQALQEWDPDRYGSLSHPGDDFSYDIFAQVAQLLRHPGALDPIAGLTPARVIAVGESQSAARMFTFVAAVHPLTRVFDGFFIHSRGIGGAALNSKPAFPQSQEALVRTDLDEPVMQFITESDLFFLQFLANRQPDDAHVVTWEVAGTAHADQATLDYGSASARRLGQDASLDLTSVCGKINEGPQALVVRKAIDALNTWVKDGTLPSSAPPLEVETTDAGGRVLKRDEHGNALGGVRTPAVDAPIASYTGQNQGAEAGILCWLFGTTTPFSTAKLKTLYPTHADYVNKVTTTAQAAVTRGHLLPADQNALVTKAQAAAVPE